MATFMWRTLRAGEYELSGEAGEPEQTNAWRSRVAGRRLLQSADTIPQRGGISN
jgi:hypothetical protein